MSNYPTNLTDKQWQVIKNKVETRQRKRKKSLQEIINAIMYLTKTGCQWRMLPKDFGPWQTVYSCFRKWKFESLFEELMHYLRETIRKQCCRNVSPSVGLIDSGSVRTHHVDSSEYGIDGGKKIKGRKEHIVVDTLGLPMAAKVHAANIYDSTGAIQPVKELRYLYPGLKKIIADGGYGGEPLAAAVKEMGWELSVVLRPKESSNKFHVLPLRWIVERTFSWIENYRRMTIDYEYKTESAEAMLQITFCQIMLKKLSKKQIQ